MCTRRRTFYVFILLSTNNNFSFCQNSSGEHQELSSSHEGGNGANSASCDNQINPERIISNVQRFIQNEMTQPLKFESNSPLTLFSQGLQVRSTSNKPVSNIRVKSSVFPIYSSQRYMDNTSPSLSIEPSASLPATITPSSELLPIYTTPINPLTTDSPEVTNMSNFPSSPSPFNSNNFQDISQIQQKPVTLQMPSMPTITPFTALATPSPGILHQTIPTETYSANYLTGLCPGLLKTRLSPFTEAGSNMFKTVPEFPIPINFKINLSQPAKVPPIIFIVTPTVSPTPQEYEPSLFMPPITPYPIVVKKRSNSTWRNLLPILLITLFDGFLCNDVGCCCTGVCNIPIPYPIPVPTNNPIILNR